MDADTLPNNGSGQAANSAVPQFKRVRRSAEERGRLLEHFEQSALSRAEFAREIGVSYQTLSLWLRRRTDAAAGHSAEPGLDGAPRFARVELEPQRGSAGALTVELEPGLRLILHSRTAVALASALIRELQQQP